VEIVSLRDHLDQLHTHDKGEDHPGNGDNDRFGKILDHGKDASVPALGRLSHFSHNLAYFGIDGIEHSC